MLRIHVLDCVSGKLRYEAVAALEKAGHTVLDPGSPATGWSDEKGEARRSRFFQLETRQAFHARFYQLSRADIVILVQPCLTGAHLEMGYATAMGKRTIILADNETPATLMQCMCDFYCLNLEEMMKAVEGGSKLLSSYIGED